jgi:sugar phosphate isomerase/epimerase
VKPWQKSKIFSNAYAAKLTAKAGHSSGFVCDFARGTTCLKNPRYYNAANLIDPAAPGFRLHFVITQLTGAALVCSSLAIFRARAGTTNLPIGFCTDDFAAAKAAGFDFAEVRIREFVKLSDEEFSNFAAHCKATGLPTLTSYWFLPPDLKVVGPDVQTNEVMNYLQKALDRCQALGVKIIVWGSGDARRAPDGFSREEAFQQLVALGKRIAPEAQKRGILIVAEPLRKAESNTINSAAEGLKWVEAVNHPNFQLLVDIYHMTEEGEDAAIIVRAGSHIRHVHMSNPRGRIFPLRADEFDYQPFFQALNKISYQGTISIEASTDHLNEEGSKAMEFIRNAYAAAGREVAKAAALPTAVK